VIDQLRFKRRDGLDSNQNNQKGVTRRGLLASATSAAVLGLSPLLVAQPAPANALSVLPSSLAALPKLRNYRTGRSSSYDRTGANADFISIDPGASATLLESKGPGMVTHIWFTINSSEDFHLKKLVLRAWWDDESQPSVEVPVGDFFGLNLGEYFLYESALTSVASIKALNAYFPMPFAKSARISVSNEGSVRTDSFYYNVDFVTLPELGSDMGYFHAQYRQAAPCRGWTDAWTNEYAPPVGDRRNLNGEGNYIFLEARGRGHFVGVTHGVVQNQEGWWGEGDEMIFIDDEPKPVINGTGTEDYYNGAWNFGGLSGAKPFSYLHNGASYIANPEHVGGRYCLYRWHLESPVSFQNSIRVTMEHGHANHRSDSFFTTAFWYQGEPHAQFPALPKVAERIPRVFGVGGPGPARLSPQS
jgi:hypothetical protein